MKTPAVLLGLLVAVAPACDAVRRSSAADKVGADDVTLRECRADLPRESTPAAPGPESRATGAGRRPVLPAHLFM